MSGYQTVLWSLPSSSLQVCSAMVIVLFEQNKMCVMYVYEVQNDVVYIFNFYRDHSQSNHRLRDNDFVIMRSVLWFLLKEFVRRRLSRNHSE